MGPGGCGWRMKKGFLQTGFCLVGLLCLSSGLFLYHQLQEKVQSSENLSLKFKQQQEALSAQLQVVYEHRSRLERSLQKERGEHKKTKEDFLVYKLEAQEALNKEKQDAMNRYGALSSQHKIQKNQHEEVKKQLMDLQAQQNTLKLQHRKVEEVHSQKYSKLQQEKEDQGLSMQDTITKLREENKLLRKAHQEVRTQLVSAQVQVEEFRRLKDALQKMPSFKELGAARGHEQVQLLVPEKKLFRALEAAMPHPDVEEDVGPDIIPPVKPTELGVKTAGGGGEQPPQVLVQPMLQAPARSGPRPEHFVPQRHPSLPPWLVNDFYALRFMRTVNSVPAADTEQKLATSIPPMKGEARLAPVAAAPQEKPALQAWQVANPSKVQVQSWQDVVKNINTKNAEAVAQMPPGTVHPRGVHVQLANPQPGMMILTANQEHEIKEGADDDEELEMDAGMIDREDDDTGAMRERIAQEPMMPEDVADPAHDPNNQGEDEFEEAALERPAFAAKRPKVNLRKEPELPAGAEPPKKANETEVQDKAEEEADDYQEDQEPDTEDHGGEVDDTEDLEMEQKDKSPDEDVGENDKKDGYY